MYNRTFRNFSIYFNKDNLYISRSALYNILLSYNKEQEQKLSIKIQVNVVIRSEGLKVNKITNLLHNIKVTFQVIYTCSN